MFVGFLLHARQFSERSDLNTVVVLDDLVDLDGRANQQTSFVALFHCLGRSQQAFYERKHSSSDQDGSRAETSAIGSNAFGGEAVPPVPGIGLGARVPCGGLGYRVKRGVGRNKA